MTALALRSVAPGQRRPVSRWVAGGAVAATLAGGALLLVPGADDGDPPPRTGSAGVVLDYEITYRTTFADGTEVEEEVAISRPFRSAVRSGETGRLSDAGVLATAGGDGRWLAIEVPIAPASGDVRIDAVLDAAVAEGHVEPGATRRIAGTTCRDHRFGGPVSAGVLTPVGTVPGEHADVCIADGGLVLRERWVVDGEVRRTREAVSVAVRSVDDDRFAVPSDARPLPFEQGGGSTEAVADDHDAGFAEHWTLATPEGFDHAGRWVVAPPAPQALEPGEVRGPEVALVSDAWVRGVDLLVLDQGATMPGVAPPWDERPVVARHDLGPAGTAEVAWDLRASEVRVLRPDGGFVRIAGTLPPDELLAIARTLTTTSPGGAS
ncbi:MAG TPA: hypothetical protein VLR27_11475 [Acidimicrobiales bacterium]|nr:hypothetical protein [Acidimicrobiales bacterium]